MVKAVQELSKSNDSLKRQQRLSDSLYTSQIHNLMMIVADCYMHGQTLKSLQNNQGQGQNSDKDTLQVNLVNNEQAILYQNQPNPFDGSTVIRYFIPSDISDISYLVFYDIFGNELNKIEITEKGNGKVLVDTKNLSSGIYTYSIIINNIIIDTKKMICNK